MQSRQEPLSKRERAELEGYLSWTAAAVRAVLFVLALAIVAALFRAAQQWLELPDPLWLPPTAALGVLLYVRARRWTGGRDLRRRIRLDLRAGAALVHEVRVQDAIVFEEREDEGPIVLVLADTGETLAFAGQELARHVARGFPWREFEIRESATSRLFLDLKRRGEKFAPSAVRPPLSAEQSERLGLSTARWQQLQVPFDDVRQIA